MQIRFFSSFHKQIQIDVDMDDFGLMTSVAVCYYVVMSIGDNHWDLLEMFDFTSNVGWVAKFDFATNYRIFGDDKPIRIENLYNKSNQIQCWHRWDAENVFEILNMFGRTQSLATKSKGNKVTPSLEFGYKIERQHV